MKLILPITILLLFSSCFNEDKKASSTNNDSIQISTKIEDIFIKSKKSLDSLFLLKSELDTFKSQDFRTSLFIGNLFSDKNKHAILSFKKNDSTSRTFILEQKNKNWDTVFNIDICPSSTSVFDDIIELADFNGDNIPDLKIVKYYWDIHPGDNSDLWLYKQGEFIEVTGFDSIVSAAFDKETGNIYSYQSTGCADMSMYFGVFRIIENKVIKIKEMNCDCCEEDSCIIEITGEEPYKVPSNIAHKHVPEFFSEGVKQKIQMEPIQYN